MYSDFESILEPIQGPGNNHRISSTRGVNIHTHLDGAFDPSLLMGKLRILLTCIEERIALKSFAII